MSKAQQVNFSDLPKRTRRAIEQARKIETAYFTKNPKAIQFERPLIPYEALGVPNNARVIVQRFGSNRVARMYQFDTEGN